MHHRIYGAVQRLHVVMQRYQILILGNIALEHCGDVPISRKSFYLFLLAVAQIREGKFGAFTRKSVGDGIRNTPFIRHA